MKGFHLQIVTPEGMSFDGDALRLIVRTTSGDIGILAGHSEYVSALGLGIAKIQVSEDTERLAACFGGLISVSKDVTRLVASSFQWAEDIDYEKAVASKERAELLLANTTADTAASSAASEAKKHAEIRIQLSKRE